MFGLKVNFIEFILRSSVKEIKRQTAVKSLDEVNQALSFDQFINPKITAKTFFL